MAIEHVLIVVPPHGFLENINLIAYTPKSVFSSLTEL